MAPLTFSQALERAEVQARRTLAPELGERLSDAVVLVKNGHCFQRDDGTWTVQSATDPAQTYTHVNGQCACSDCHYNKPPQGLCKHRLSVYLARRVFELMAAPTPEEGSLKDRPPAVLPQSPPVLTERVSQPLPEAPASVNVRIQIEGRDIQWTLRDHDEARLAVRLDALLARYPVPQPASPAASQGQDAEKRSDNKTVAGSAPGWCAVHNVEMRWNEGKDGRKGWYSHRTDEGWCKGR